MTDQPTTDDLLFPLLVEASHEGDLDINEQDIRDGHHRIEPFALLARKAFDLGVQHAERKRFGVAPPVDTTPLDDAIIDHLTRAQRHWLVGVDRAGAPDFTAHMEHYINRTRVAFLLVAFRAFMPSVATTVAVELASMLANPPVGAMWVWEQLVDNGIDPATLTAFSPPKPRADGTPAELSGKQDGAAS